MSVTNLKQKPLGKKKLTKIKAVGSEEEREGKGDEKKRMKGKEKKWKEKKWKGKGEKEEIKDYKYRLRGSVLDRLNKQLFTEGGNA